MEYTELEFKCIIKKEYRKEFGIILNNDGIYNHWSKATIKELKDFANYSRSSFIPFVASESENKYNKSTGKWEFICVLKNYNETIEKFLSIIPKFIESLELCKTKYEENDYYDIYRLIDKKIELYNKNNLLVNDE